MNNRLATLFAVLLCVTSSNVHAQDSASIAGQVLEKGTTRPIAGVSITVIERPAVKAISGSSGQFTLVLPAGGRYTVRASAAGYDTPTDQVLDLSESGARPAITFYLEAVATLNPVVITAKRIYHHVSASTLSADDAKNVPGTMGDPLRAVQSLPGVTAPAGGGSRIAVHGVASTDNAYYLDALPVGYIFHMDGSSIFNPDLLSKFELYTGAWPPYYADVLGGVLDATLRAPRTDRIGGAASVSLLKGSAMVEGPVSNGQSFYLSVRRSYLDLLLPQKTAPNGVEFHYPASRDYQGRYLWHINDSNRLSIYLNGASDHLRANVPAASNLGLSQPVLVGNIAFGESYAMQAVMLDSMLSESTYNKLSVGHMSEIQAGNAGTSTSVNADQQSRFVRELLNFPLAEHHDITLGANYRTSTANINVSGPTPRCTYFDPNCDPTTAPVVAFNGSIPYTLWDRSLRDRWAATSRLTLIAGVRDSHDTYLHRAYTEPRLGVEWAWTKRTRLSAGWGKHNEMPNRQQVAPNLGNPGLSHLRAEQYVAGFTHTLDDGWSWKSEGYYKRLYDLVLLDPAIGNYANAGSGKAYGIETLIKKKETARLSGWFALTLSRTERRNDLTGQHFRYSLDEPVIANMVGRYKLTEVWNLGIKFTFHSGQLYTPVIGTNGTYADGRVRPLYGGTFSRRLPNWARLDLRVDRVRNYGSRKLTLYFELLNATGHKNVASYYYSPDYQTRYTTYDTFGQGPFLNVGLEATF